MGLIETVVQRTKMSKEELCCIVNTVDNCCKCRQKKCSDHAFRCGEDGLYYCNACNTRSECTRCGDDLCRGCSRLNDSEEVTCPTCLRVDKDNEDDDYDYDSCPCGCDEL